VAPFFNPERCTYNKKNEKTRHPPHTELSDRRCRDCGMKIKKKLVLVASANKHKPPEVCYRCLCLKKNKKTARERKVILGKERARAREALKKPG